MVEVLDQQEADHAAHAPVVVPQPPEYDIETVARQSFNRHPDIDPNWQSDDEWLEWSGGYEPPIDGAAHVLLKFRDGSNSEGKWMARHYNWQHRGNDDDIVKWKPA